MATSRLNLPTFDETTADKASKFLAFRKSLAGSSNSAMTKLDDAYGELRDDLDIATDTDIQTIINTIK